MKQYSFPHLIELIIIVLFYLLVLLLLLDRFQKDYQDLINKIDELVESYNTLIETNKNLADQLAELKLAKSSDIITPDVEIK